MDTDLFPRYSRTDLGEMLGEHGMWFKRTFYEGSANVPLIMSLPGGQHAGRVIDSTVSLLDVYPTLLDLAGADIPGEIDGQNLMPLASGAHKGRDEAFCEFYGDGVLAPCRMIQRGGYKLVYTHQQKGELYDLDDDPQEMNNLIDSPDHAQVRDELLARSLENWDPDEIDRRVRASQKRRRFIANVRLDNGHPWQFTLPPVGTAEHAYIKPRVGAGTLLNEEI